MGNDISTARDEDNVPFGIQLIFIWAVIVIQLLWQNLSAAVTSLLDTDDAMRLVEVRALLNGRGWFDLHEPRVAPPQGYDTHWSRLVDGGLAGLYGIFRMFTSPDTAEFLMRVTWPLLWLGVTLAAIMATARRLGGEASLFASGFIAALSLSAFYQFSPGRIDHHCVQIGLTMLALAGVTWSDRRAGAAAAAGIAAALAMAVGLECLPILALLAGALTARWLQDPGQGRAASLFFASFAVALAAAYAGSVSSARLTLTACDALAWNSAAAVIPGSIAMAVVTRYASAARLKVRLSTVILIGLSVLTFALLLEPRCIHGPFALVPPEARSLWLDRVQENQPLLAYLGDVVFAINGIPLIILSIFACAPLFAPSRRRDPAVLTVSAACAVSILLAFNSIKMVIYALWLVIPLLALSTSMLWARFDIRSTLLRVVTAALFAPFAYIMLAAGLETLVAGKPTDDQGSGTCNQPVDYRQLAQLSKGLVLTGVDTGPFVLANTLHSVWAAPYHRLGPQIVEAIELFDGPAEDAEAKVRKMGADYVAICWPKAKVPPVMKPGEGTPGFTVSLLSGTPPAWLIPIDGGDGNLRIFRVVK